jgi:hypothetical protein
MIHVMILNFREHLTREQRADILVRRAQWKYPPGLKVHGEYWLSSDAPGVVVICEADTYEPVMDVWMAWSDYFSISTYAATTLEEGLAIGQSAMQRQLQSA